MNGCVYRNCHYHLTLSLLQWYMNSEVFLPRTPRKRGSQFEGVRTWFWNCHPASKIPLVYSVRVAKLQHAWITECLSLTQDTYTASNYDCMTNRDVTRDFRAHEEPCQLLTGTTGSEVWTSAKYSIWNKSDDCKGLQRFTRGCTMQCLQLPPWISKTFHIMLIQITF